MKFDDFKKELRNEKIEIPDVKEKIKESSEFKNRMVYQKNNSIILSKNKILRLSFSVFMVALIAVLAIVYTRTNYQAPVKSTSNSINYLKDQNELKEVLSYDFSPNKIKLINEWANIGINLLEKTNMDYENSSPMPESIDNQTYSYNGDSKKGLSKTNNQIENVDEADVVKCDGKRIYRLSHDKIYINAINDGQIDQNKIEININEYFNIYDAQMYLTKNYIVVVYCGYSNEANYKNYDYKNKIGVKIFDINTLQLVKTYDAPYTYIIDSRIVNGENDVLYLTFNQYIERKNEQYFLPQNYIDGKLINFEYSDISYYNNIYNTAYTFVVSIKLDNDLKVNTKVQLGCGSWSCLYVTENSLYFASTLSSYIFNRYVNYDFDFKESYITSIIKYEINDGEITPIATLQTDGQVKNQFFMSEYDDYFRVALSEKNYNKVEIYKIVDEQGNKTFELVGKVDQNLGELNEEIKSVTFKGDYCLVVTAKSTDPMYKIDLSNPNKPTILGKFKEEGYNSYLQYLTGDLEGLAFGLGYLTHDISDYYNVKDASKLGLYDVTGENPIQLDLITYDYTEATENHKALFVYEDYIGLLADNNYYIYRIEKVDDLNTTYKFKEEIRYQLPKTDYYNYYNTFGRCYYVDGFFYIIMSSVYGSNYDEIVCYDSSFNLLCKAN